MKIIIAGVGVLGSHLVRQLSSEYHDIIAIDDDQQRIDYIQSVSDIMGIKGSASSVSVLQQAGVKDAELVIAVTSNEETNIATAIFAKQLGAKKTVARVANEEYVGAGCAIDFAKLGIDHLVYPEELAAIEIVNLVKRTAATDIVEFEEGQLSLIGLRLDADAPIVNKTLKEVAAEYPKFNFRIVAIQRNTQTLMPSGDDKFLKNDQIFVITTPDGVKHILSLAGKSDIEFNNMMILGGGKIGKTVAKMLENDMNIKLIESKREKTLRLADQLANTLVIHGDGRDIDLLAQESIIDMDAFIAVTEDSETNIISCLMAKHLGVKKVVALMDNVDYIPLAQTIGLDSLINQKLLAVGSITRAIRKGSIVSTANLQGIEAEVLEFNCKDGMPVTKAPIKKLNFPSEAIIGGIVRDGKGVITVGDTLIQEDDKVVVFSLPKGLEKVKKFFS